MFRFCALLVLAFGLSACEDISDLSKAPSPIGEFSLGHNVVVAPNLVMGPASREASSDAWIAAVSKAVDERFSRYDGEQLYHFGISLEGYVLAQPGLPIVLSPKSVLILKLTVWDDAAGTKLNDKPEQITVLETLDGDTIVGSGLTKTAEEQMETLAENSAKLIQRWITRQHRSELWFKRKAGPAAPEEAVEKAAEEVAPARKKATKAVATAAKATKSDAEDAVVAATSN
ncbi:MAG: hypothetical protein WBC85_15790 [Planktotalea sp.]|uniref:hypothetical protein n=1 Tax=Planktotalea sp. TaxID=2029877 RepID=UPI003C7383D7